MKKLLAYLKPYAMESVVGPLFKLLEACFELAVPLVMAAVIDRGVPAGDRGYALSMGAVLVGLGLLGFVSSLTAQYFAAKASMGFGTGLRQAVFHHINTLAQVQLEQAGAPSLVTRLTVDINQAQAGVNLVLRLFLRSPFIVIGAVLMSLFIDVKLTVIFLAASPLLALCIYLVMRFTLPMYRGIQGRLDLVSKLTRQNLSGARVIRAFSRQKDEQAAFVDASSQLTQAQLLAGRISALLNPATFTIVNLAVLCILWFGGVRVNAGQLSQGQLIALINYMSQILLALVALANLIISMTRATASMQRIAELMAIKPTVVDRAVAVPTPESGAAKLAFQNVYFSYPGAQDFALSAIDFAVRQGQWIGVIGGTGSGKSTLVNLIPRFFDPSAGVVLLDGRPLQDYPLKVLRNRVGIVPQRASLFRGTIRSNLLFGNEKASEEDLWRALEIAQAADFVREKEDGLDAPVLQDGKNLSGGQRQRLTIARALVKRPQILILDDSASALDYATEAALRKALRENGFGTTVFVVSQRVASIQNADAILVLEDGHMAGFASHGALYQTSEVYKEICHSQLKSEEVRRG